jgi:hypothetical protein
MEAMIDAPDGSTATYDAERRSAINSHVPNVSIRYEGQVSGLPNELVHEVTVGNDGGFSTRVYQIEPDPLSAVPIL